MDPLKPMLARFKAEKLQLEQSLQPLNWDPASWGAALAQWLNPKEVETSRERLKFLTDEIARLEKMVGGGTLTEREYNTELNRQNGILPKLGASVTLTTTAFGRMVNIAESLIQKGVPLVDITQKLHDEGISWAQAMDVGTIAMQAQFPIEAQLAKARLAHGESLLAFTNNTKAAVIEEQRHRAALLGYVTAHHLAANATSLTNEQLETLIQASLGSKDAIKALDEQWKTDHAVMLQVSAGLDDIVNQYQVRLNPALVRTTKQLEDAKAAVADFDKALKDLKDPTELFSLKPFKLKFEVDKEFNQFFKDLPKGLRGKVKLTVQSEAANKNVGQLLGLIAKTEIQLPIKFQTSDTEANKFIDDTIQSIKDQLKKKGTDLAKSPEIQAAINKMLEIRKAPDSWAKLTQYFTSPEFLATISKIDPKTAEILKALLPAPTQADAPDWLKDPNLDKFLPNAKAAFQASVTKTLATDIPAPTMTQYAQGLK